MGTKLACSEIEIAAEFPDTLVIFKPAGIHSVELPESIEQGPAVASWLKERKPAAINVSLKPEDAGLVQRLDFDSCGLLLAATTRARWEILQAAVKAGELDKRYLIVTPLGFPPQVEVQGYLGNRHRGSERVTNFKHPPKDGRALPAKTKFTLLAQNEKLGLSLISASAGAARRHQVRAHAAEAGFPLVGDTLYGSTGALPPELASLYARKGYLARFFLFAQAISSFRPELKISCNLALAPQLLEFFPEAKTCTGPEI